MPDNGLFHAINRTWSNPRPRPTSTTSTTNTTSTTITTSTTLPHRTELAQDSLCLPFAAGGVKQDGVGT
ncbi:hypothetical protein ACLKA7_014975 [Drosophila subpalustris]